MSLRRLKFNIDAEVPGLRKILFTFRPEEATCFDSLASHVCRRLCVQTGYGLEFYLDEFLIPGWTSTKAVRDDEELIVKSVFKLTRYFN